MPQDAAMCEACNGYGRVWRVPVAGGFAPERCAPCKGSGSRVGKPVVIDVSGRSYPLASEVGELVELLEAAE